MERQQLSPELCLAVMGNAAEFALIDITSPEPLEPAIAEEAARRGWNYAGCFGICDGDVVTQCEPGLINNLLMARAVLHAAPVLARHLQETPEAIGDTTAWLKGLHALSDTRSEVADA